MIVIKKTIKKKLFKWIGGKSWLIKDLNSLYEKILSKKEIDTYIEPFGGGLGSLMGSLEILRENNVNNIIINDINQPMINLYNLIKNDYKSFYNEYIQLEFNYNSLIPKEVLKLKEKEDKKEIKKLLIEAESFFYQQRKLFNEIKSDDNKKNEASVLFFFLSQHSFNGVYRENLKGLYNSPFNWSNKLVNIEERFKTLEIYHNLFNEYDIKFVNMSVFKLLEKYGNSEKILYYFDPPYLNEKGVENKYNENDFGINSQLKLLTEMINIPNVIFSNHYNEIFVKFCEENKFNHIKIFRKNVMTSSGDDRGNKVAEILAYN